MGGSFGFVVHEEEQEIPLAQRMWRNCQKRFFHIEIHCFSAWLFAKNKTVTASQDDDARMLHG